MARGDLNTYQGRGHERGASVSDREVETLVMKVLTHKLGLSERTILLLQEITGERGEAGKPGAAVRRSDLNAISRVTPMTSSQATSAPSAAEFNALRDDVRKLYEALEVIARHMKRG